MSSLVLLGLVVLGAPQASAQHTVNPEAKAPAGASKLVDPSFPSFGIQVSSFPAFTGNTESPNVFSQNLIKSIENRTGAPLVVRVGGTNGDYSNYNPAQNSAVEPPMEGDGIGQKFVLGPEFYQGFKNWGDTLWVYDIPFAAANKTDSIDQAKQALSNIGDNLFALELGNEVDLYVNQKARADGWGPADYVSQFLSYSASLKQSLSLADKALWQVLTLSSDSAGATWTAEAVFSAGITKDNTVKSVSFHHYENTDTGDQLQETLLNHTFVKNGIDKSFSSDFAYLKKNYPDTEIVLGESGRYTLNGSSTDQTEGVFGSALWTADYLLYAMSQDVTRVHMQLSKVFGYVAWHPVAYNGLDPEVRAPYYGHLFVADFMGGSKNFRVSEVELQDELAAAYAGYENDEIKRVALFNYNAWSEGSGDRPSSTFELSVPENVKSVSIQTLTSPGGAKATDTFYWAGNTWTYESKGVAQRVPSIPESTSANVENGSVTVSVGASEAVIVHYES